MESLYKLVVVIIVLILSINTIYCTEDVKTGLPSLHKCCSFDQIVGQKNGTQKVCMSTNKPLLYTKIRVFDYKMKITNKTISNDNFNLVPGKFYADEDFHNKSINSNIRAFLKSNFYLTESALLYLETPNAYKRWTKFDQNNFCVDFYTNRKTGVIKPAFWIRMEVQSKAQKFYLLTVAMMISCCFLLAVLLVYAILPYLRNLGGMILMAYVASLFVAFLFLALIRIQTQENNHNVCYFMTLTIYYFFLASFCWMNVMSYDIWWTFRGYAKTRPIHRRGEPFKYMMYSLYAWGLPLAMTIMLACIDKADLSHKPWFIKPNLKTSCFIGDGEKLLYLYVPMLILILANWLFFLLTAWNIWRLSRGTSVLDSGAAGTPSPHRSNQQRFLLYLKLTVVMGLNWVMEVISFLVPGFRVWYITDIYNVLLGVLIFLIFVCKKKILRKLSNLYSQQGKKGQYNISTTTRDSSEGNQEQPMMLASPKKQSYVVNDF